MDYEDKEKRSKEKSLEVIWRGSKTFGSSAQIFTNIFPVNYAPPPGFHFEVKDGNYLLLQDNPLLFDMNIEQRVNDFINATITQANITRTNHIMWAMGDDFVYQYAETWFKQMDKLIHYVNKDGRINALYSTPSIYTDAKNAENEKWPLKTDDFFPYAERAHSYWTGYFTSRPSFKRYVRALSGYYLAAKQLEFLAGRKPNGPNTFSLGDALGIAQHHDAITGTAKQHVNDDYTKRLSLGASEAQAVTNLALSYVTSSIQQRTTPEVKFSQCPLLNISYCPPTEAEIQKGKSLVVVAYNPLGWSRTDIVRIPVNDPYLFVKDTKGNTIESQNVEMDKVTKNLRRNYTEAYLGISVNKQETPKYWLLFQASVPPLGWTTYFITNKPEVQTGHRRRVDMDKSTAQNETVEVGPGNLKMSFSLKTGQLQRMLNSKTGVDMRMQQNYLWYASSTGDMMDSQASGAYVFRPNSSSSFPVSNSVVPLKIVRGPLVHEVHQQFSSWVYQVTRLYKDKDHAEVEFIVSLFVKMEVTNKKDSINLNVVSRVNTNFDAPFEGEVNVTLDVPFGITQEAVPVWPSWLSPIPTDAIKGWSPRSSSSFEILHEIGQDSRCQVFKSRNIMTGKIVALKKLKLHTWEPEYVEDMAQEILVLRRLDSHPNVMKLEGLVLIHEEPLSLYLVFEYMEHNLADLIITHKIKFTEPQVKYYMHQLLLGLEYCHRRGVVHGNINGFNLLISNKGILKIAGFGTAASISCPNHNQYGMVSGTIPVLYRAPEFCFRRPAHSSVGADLTSSVLARKLRMVS